MALFRNPFGPPSKDVFAREMISALRRAGDREDIVYERAQFRLVRPKTKAVTNLGSLYAEHCSLPRSQRKAHLQQLAQTFLSTQEELPASFEEARPHLRPKIWTRAQFANLELQRQLEGGQPLDIPLYPLGEHLLMSVVYDLPASMRTLSGEDLQRWNIGYYEAMEAARINLDESTLAWARLGEGFYSATSGDNYDSSRILLTDGIREFELPGEPIAMIPARDAAYLAGSDDPDGLKIMLDLSERALADDPRPLSGVALRLVDEEWEDWQPPPGHPHHAAFTWLAQMFLGTLYAEQRKLLMALYEQERKDIFVASFSAVESSRTGEKRSYCVWGEGVDAVLPQTQYIMLPTTAGVHGEDPPSLGGPWSQVRAVVGDLMQPVPDLYPPRFRVREFPSQQQLEAIGALEL